MSPSVTVRLRINSNKTNTRPATAIGITRSKYTLEQC